MNEEPAGQLRAFGRGVTGVVSRELREHWHLLGDLAKWIVLGCVIGALAGVAAAVFLYGLALATDARGAQPWLLWLLPVGGLAMGLAYHYLGGRAAEGNNLILDEIHGLDPAGPVPASDHRWVPRRMAPMVLAGTWITHLLGGSAGREGTAIQMSGSLADTVSRLLRLGPHDRRIVLIAGIAGGFGAVFGVPLAGTVFALEVQSVGRIRHDALVPALAASVTGNLVTHALGLYHHATPRITLPATPLEPRLLAVVAIAGLAFAAAAILFSELTLWLRRGFRLVRWAPARPFIGGLAVIGLTLWAGERDYLGLSLPLIGAAYTGGVAASAFAWKLLFTSVTLGSGFQGGEVTPLFVVGATLGATLSGVLDAPPALLAAAGLVAVFAAATNTPIACTIMGVELFGAAALPYLAVACAVAYVFSAHRGIYEAQRVDTPKSRLLPHAPGGRLDELGSLRRGKPPT